MAETVYILCALTALLCTILLLRGYMRARSSFLLWSGICFAGLTLNNILLFVDKVVLPEHVSLEPGRSLTALVALLLLLYGMIWDVE